MRNSNRIAGPLLHETRPEKWRARESHRSTASRQEHAALGSAGHQPAFAVSRRLATNLRARASRHFVAASLGLLALFAPATAFAGGGGGVCKADHWSWMAEALPEATVHNMCHAIGKTATGAEAPDRVMHIIWGIIIFLVVLGMAGVASAKFKQKGEEAVLPERAFGIFTFFELCSEALYGLMKDMMGEKYARHFFPIIAALFFFIIISNLMGLVPGFLNATDNFNTTLALASIPFLLTHWYGVKEHGFVHYFAHFLGPIRKIYALPLMFLMLFIEIISHLARPASLAIRLMGNMFGDHAVLAAFMGFGLIFVPLPVMVLGTIVCIVQALVFCLLSIVYISMAVAHEEH